MNLKNPKTEGQVNEKTSDKPVSFKDNKTEDLVSELKTRGILCLDKAGFDRVVALTFQGAVRMAPHSKIESAKKQVLRGMELDKFWADEKAT